MTLSLNISTFSTEYPSSFDGAGLPEIVAEVKAVLRVEVDLGPNPSHRRAADHAVGLVVSANPSHPIAEVRATLLAVTQKARNESDRWIEIGTIVGLTSLQNIGHVIIELIGKQKIIVIQIVKELMTESVPRGPEVGRRYHEAAVGAEALVEIEVRRDTRSTTETERKARTIIGMVSTTEEEVVKRIPDDTDKCIVTIFIRNHIDLADK